MKVPSISDLKGTEFKFNETFTEKKFQVDYHFKLTSITSQSKNFIQENLFVGNWILFQAKATLHH